MTLAKNIAHVLGNGKEQKNGTGWLTCCPVHGDEKPSLSIRDKGGSSGPPDITVKCHAGCDFRAVKDEIRARGLMPKWEPASKQQRPHNGSKTSAEERKKNLVPYIWKQSRKDTEAQEVIKAAFAFRGIDLEEIHPNMRLNEYKGKRSIVCAMQYPLETKDAEEPLALHMTLLNTKGEKTGTRYQGEKKGLAVLLYNDDDRLIIGEGLETTLSAIQATKYSGMVCGDAGNLAAVTRITDRFSKVYILVDSDTKEKNCTGQRAALEAAENIAQANKGASVFLVTSDDSCFTGQPIKKDFNDLSAEVIQERFAQAIKVSDKRVEQLKLNMEWKDPLPIKDELPQVEPMREDMIPEAFRAWVTDAAGRMQVPVDYLVVPLLVVCGSLIGTSCQVRPKQQDDWSEVPNLWGGIVGPPSMMKTPALNEAVNKTLGRLEAEAGKEYQAAQDTYKADEMVAKARQKKLQADINKAVKNPKETDKSPEELAAELQKIRTGKPVERRYKTNDSSIEKIVELLRDNPRGLLYFRDELIALFRRMERAGNEQDRGFMLEAWSGNGCHIDDRIGRGTVRADNICISLLGSIQPDKIAEYLNRAVTKGENDGFVQRLQLMVYPDPVKAWEYIDQRPNSAAKNRGYKVIKALAELAVMPPEPTEDKTYLRFSGEGQAILKEWLTRLQLEKLEDENDHPIILEHLAKYRSLMPSLALIFHLIECVDIGRIPDPISKEAAETAAQWCNYLESHARRIYSLATNTGKRGGETLARKIKSKTLKDGFKLREIQMKKWSLLSSGESIQDALDWLIEKHWIEETELEKSSAKGGRPPACSYRINPKIFSL